MALSFSRPIGALLLFVITVNGRAVEPPSPQPPAELRFVTYNVLADPVQVETRVPALFRILRESNADIMVLQEVAPWMAEKILKEKWAGDYHRPMYNGKTVIAHEYLLLSKYPILDFTTQPLPGLQHRVLFLATLDIAGVKTAVATCHLESLLEDGPIRAQQLDLYRAALKPSDEAFFAGDFNFGDGEQPDTDHLPADLADAWLQLHPQDPGYTWDVRKSRFALEESFPGEGSRRLDRILFKSTRWQSVSATIIGDQPLDEKRRRNFPSDHFGVLAVFRLRSATPGDGSTNS